MPISNQHAFAFILFENLAHILDVVHAFVKDLLNLYEF